MPEKPLIVLVGMREGTMPQWARTLESDLSQDYAFTVYNSPDRYVSRLTMDYAALVLVDGNADNWKFWTATPKSNPATRRIPVFVISDDLKRRAPALLSGADNVLTPSELKRTASKVFEDFARVFDPKRAELLENECQQTLPELARQGIAMFNAGEFYKQHDLFEALWMKTEGPVRDLYRAILQVGVAYYQIQQGNPRGAKKMLLRSVQWLTILPDVCQGVDVKALRRDSARVRAELERLDETNFDQFDMSLIQPVKMVG